MEGEGWEHSPMPSATSAGEQMLARPCRMAAITGCSSAQTPRTVPMSPGARRQLLPTQHIFRQSHPRRLKADKQGGTQVENPDFQPCIGDLV